MKPADSPPNAGQLVSRRRFVRDAGLATAATLNALRAAPADARPRRRHRARPTVAVFGGGVAGLTAAHELAERGFAVTVYERRAWGGKARSFDVPGTARGGRAPLPGEHSTYIVLGSYQNLPDTLRRIPVAGNRNGVLDNVIPMPELEFARMGNDDFTVLLGHRPPPAAHPDFAVKFAEHVPANELAYFIDRLGVFFTSCDARRIGQWDKTSWWDFLAADRFSDPYQKLLVNSFTRALAAQDPQRVSARAYGLFFEGFMAVLLGQHSGLPMSNCYSAPKQEALFDPWLSYLEGLGVRPMLGPELTSFEMRGGRICGATVRSPRGTHRVEADYYVCALPMDRALGTFTHEMRAADPALDLVDQFATRWSNGVQFYLREPIPLARGWVAFADSPWAIVGCMQAQFWPHHVFARDYGDGQVQDCFSVAISEYDVPGILYGKTARQCNKQEIVAELWAQMNAHLGDSGGPVLPFDLVHSWCIDPGLTFGRGGIIANEDPLVQNLAGYYLKRPTPQTAIPNFALAGDWVRTDFPPPTSEAANESGRKACNAILRASGSSAAPCRIFEPFHPPQYAAARVADEALYTAGLPNALDVPGLGTVARLVP